jgi:hypothetical protein
MKLTTTKRASDAWAFRSLLTFPFSAFLLVISFTVIFFAVSSTRGRHQVTNAYAIEVNCYGDGSALFFYGSTEAAKVLWDPRLFLSITLGFGRFTYAQAKTVDFAWDIIVGTGGQAVMIALVYPLFRRAIFAQLEKRPIAMHTYTTLALDRVLLSSICAMLGDLWPKKATRPSSIWQRPRRKRPKDFELVEPTPECHNKIGKRPCNFLWPSLIYAFIYLLASAKVLSLMTGYEAVSTLTIKLNGEWLDASTVTVASLVLHDGSRLGYQDMYGVAYGAPEYAALSNCTSSSISCFAVPYLANEMKI